MIADNRITAFSAITAFSVSTVITEPTVLPAILDTGVPKTPPTSGRQVF